MKTLLTIIVVSLALSACSNNDKNSSLIFEELNESLERSNKTLERDISYTMMRLKDLLKAPEASEKGAILLTTGQRIQSYSEVIVKMIDSLYARIKTDKNRNEQLTKETADLHLGLSTFHRDVLSVDASLQKEFEHSISTGDSSFCKRFPDREAFATFYFDNKSAMLQLLTLSKFKNDVLNCEYQMLLYLRNSLCVLPVVYDKTQAIATINSSVFKTGQEMIIQAGVGAFSTVGDPTFEMSGVDVKPNENGVGEYRMKIIQKPGDYKVRVKIKYKKPDGKESALEKDFEYSVIE